ncbi:CRISPR-associated protein Cas5 [Occultella kanbiaonis]
MSARFRDPSTSHGAAPTRPFPHPSGVKDRRRRRERWRPRPAHRLM